LEVGGRKLARLSFTPRIQRHSLRDRFRGLEGEAPREDRKSPKERLFVERQEVVAPGDRSSERLLSLGQITRAMHKQRQTAIEPGQHLVRVQDVDA
jgi:hypothetical protein